MIKWAKSITDAGLSQKVFDKVKPEAPLKTKIEEAHRKLQLQVDKLDGIYEKLQRKHDFIFDKIVTAQRSNNFTYAKAYAVELSQLRKMKNMIGGAKLALEQIQIRLNTVSELGDVIVTLSPAMSVIRGLGASLGGLMPEANSYMEDLSKMLGDVIHSSAVGPANAFNINDNTNADTVAILEEAHRIIEGQTKASLPELPTVMKEESSALKKEALI